MITVMFFLQFTFKDSHTQKRHMRMKDMNSYFRAIDRLRRELLEDTNLTR